MILDRLTANAVARLRPIPDTDRFELFYWSNLKGRWTTFGNLGRMKLMLENAQLDFGQNLNGLAIDQGAKHGVHQFLYGHGQAETTEKFAVVYSLPRKCALPRVIQIGQSRAQEIVENSPMFHSLRHCGSR